MLKQAGWAMKMREVIPCIVVDYAVLRLDKFLVDSFQFRSNDCDPGKLTAPECINL